MSPQEKLQYIKSKVHLACPELLELSFGCEVRWQKDLSKDNFEKGKFLGKFDRWARVYAPSKYSLNTRGVLIRALGELEIIGHPITLAHILRTMQSLNSNNENRHWVVNRWGEFLKDRKDIPAADVGEKWNLVRDNLNDQSEICINFLFDILK